MPTGRDHAVTRATLELNRQADQVEEKIEQQIQAGKLTIVLGSDSLSGEFGLPSGIQYEALKIVEVRYRQAGWHVSVWDSQRDGFGITIRAYSAV